eukprot:TRINITY_DN183_c3_g1_i1.p1 TRINITY_DN183_c3_g1~~TRINITY_DN183_c3_g1_i1.p1  ORF type:complete len:199 (+),score=54.65 TRINITY_DN183_c3_g1_i1:45-641(+)
MTSPVLLSSASCSSTSSPASLSSSSSSSSSSLVCDAKSINYVTYSSEKQLAGIVALIEKELSEPYSIFTYRYFINNWPDLCIMAMAGDKCIGAIVCKISRTKTKITKGYIAMLAVQHEYRKLGIGSSLVIKAVDTMKSMKADVVVLETEVSNKGALRLYEKLDFCRDKRMYKYYLNGGDAFRLKLWLSPPANPTYETI